MSKSFGFFSSGFIFVILTLRCPIIIALDALSHMKFYTRLKPDARTYTSLISTVARRDTRASGSKDPDLAFALFDEMTKVHGIQPNGMTYCALIDVCGRCGRSDLALKVLRMMLRQREMRKQQSKNQRNGSNYNDLELEVGAWSAAINSFGKAGRLDTAIRIFHSMPTKFGVKPNIITCGCLMDCLLKSGKSSHVKEALNVLNYMQEEGLEPSEVMYTSLITSAGRLARSENDKRGEIVLTDFGDRTLRITDGKPRMKALDVYEELLLSVTNAKHFSTNESKMNSTDASNKMVKTFLIFQEMKAAGADPDIACYNALLRACAESGDIAKLRDILLRIEGDGLTPNETTWKELLRGALKSRKSEIAEEFWNTALTYTRDDADDRYKFTTWVPSVESFVLLLTSYYAQASDEKDFDKMSLLHGKVIYSYIAVLEGKEEMGFNNIDINLLHQNKRGMSMILKSLKSNLEYNCIGSEDESKLRELIDNIKYLDCF